METKIKWLIYTVLVGLIPILSRLLVWQTMTNYSVDAFCATDFVAFGLVLHISNINEIGYIQSIDKTWKTLQSGASIIFVVFYGVLFALALVAEKNSSIFNVVTINRIIFVLSGLSFLISYSVYDRISKLHVCGDRK